MNSHDSSSVKWLAANNGVMKWRLIGPNISNPFDSQAADGRLDDYANDRSSLMSVCCIQALMDETVIVKIKDLITFDFETEHPNLADLTPENLKKFLEDSGNWAAISADFLKLQDRCREELKTRRGM